MKGETRGPPPSCPSNTPPSLPLLVGGRCLLSSAPLLLLLLLCGCLHAAEAEKCMRLKENGKSLPPQRYLYDSWKQQELPIKLDTSERLSHQLATALTKILLQEGLGYQNVTITQYSNTFNHNWVLSRLKSTGHAIPEAMLNMEVWIPPTANDLNITAESDCGKHASGGRFGWFVSKNSSNAPGVITDHWRSFQRPEVAQIFSLDDQEEINLRHNYTVDTIHTRHGETRYWCEKEYCEEGVFTPPLCVDQHCATLFIGNHSDYNAFLKEQVEKESLLVRLAWVGPNLTPQFLCFFRGNKPIMFFDWWPNSLSNQDNFMPVSFPSCYSSYSVDPYLCNYELHALKKYMWKDLQKSAKPAVEAVRRFFLSEQYYRELISNFTTRNQNCSSNTTAVQLPNQSQLVDEVACNWLKAGGKRVWYEWLPVQHDAKTVLWIGGIFPMSNESSVGFSSKSLVNAARLAYQRINKNPDILLDYEIKVINLNGGCRRETVLTAFMHHIRKESGDMDFAQMIGILGPACSDTVEPLVGVAETFKTVVMSYSAEGAIFNYSKFPYFFRTIPENKIYGTVYKKLFEQLQWKQVGALTEDSNKYSEYLSDLLYNVTDGVKVTNVKMKTSDNVVEVSERLNKLDTHKIIIGDFYANKARDVMCQAYHLNMTARHGYVWFLPRWFNTNWYNTSIFIGKDRKKIPCTTAQMLEAIDRHMSLGFAYYAPDDVINYENMTVSQWRQEYKRNNMDEPPDYAGYTYDAVWAYALALDRLLKEDRTHVSNLHTFRTVVRFSEIISKTSFSGVSGMINFRRNSSDPHNSISDTQLVNIMQFIVDDKMKGGSYITVGTFNPQGTKLDLDLGDLRFFRGIPKDGLIEDTCLFETFSQLLGVACDQAIVIVMVLIFVVFAFILIALFIVYKRRFEKMLPDSSWPLGELISLDEWELPREKVVINRTIGEGAFGTVFGGECQFADNSPWLAVAVKTLKVGSTVEEKLDFLGEAEMMKRFNHKNIVQLLGLCTHQEPIYMVMEFMLYGDLKTYLLARRHLVSDRTVHSEEDEINSKRLTSMALDVGKALAYLADLRYVHRDVACRNCLVSAERVVKLSDFGMTRPMYESDYYRFNRRGMLPVRWMSPESLEDGIFTSSSDMWSYGVLLYEIITFGSFPFQASLERRGGT
ncbi:Insulin-like peptide receptor [Chionoecetes opilio]|uniref:receptor protein-tyrosine kinase n=1 Tax=Chionoecetes opilio TaxID=41210 RepID=A0A8J4XMT8_CHIOP|nr:Insulin-like peptide receptor [Chionoecetes opilio]